MTVARAEFVASATKWIEALRQVEREGGKAISNISAKAVQLAQQEQRAIAAAAKTAATATAKAATQSTAAIAGLSAGSQDAAQGLRMIAMQGPDIAQQLAAGVPVMTVISQQGGQIVQQAMMMPGAFAAAGSAILGVLAPIAPALAVVVMGIGAYYYEAGIAQRETRDLGGSIDGLSLSLEALEKNQAAGKAAIDDFRETVRKSALEIAVLRGEITELAAKQSEAARTAALGIKPGIDAAAQAMVAAQKEVEVLEERYARFLQVADDTDVYLSDPSDELQAANKRLAAAQEHLSALKEERIRGQEVIETAIALQDAQKQAAKAGKSRSKDEREAAKLAEEHARALRSVYEMSAGAASDLLSDEQRILQARDEQLRKLYELETAATDWAAVDAAAVEIVARAERDLADARSAEDEKQRARQQSLHEDAIKKLKEQQEQAKATQNAIFSMTAGLLGDVATIASGMQAEQSRAGKAAFVVQKAASIAQAQVLAIQAFLQGNASAPPPLGQILGGVALGLAEIKIAQMAAVKPPTAYIGGSPEVVGPAAGVHTIVHQGEVVMDRQTVREMRTPQRAPEISIDGRDLLRSAARHTRSSRRYADQLQVRPGRVGRRVYGG